MNFNIWLKFFAIEPDTNGSVSFSELVALMNDVKNGHDEKLKELLLQNLFKHYDKNHDGTISFKGIILNIFENIKYV